MFYHQLPLRIKLRKGITIIQYNTTFSLHCLDLILFMNLVIEALNNRSHQSWDIDTSLCSILYTNYQQIKFTIVGHKVSHFCVSLIFFIYLNTLVKKNTSKDLILPKQCWSGRVQIILSETPIICVNQTQSSSPYSSISIPISYVSKNLTDALKSKTETWKYKAKPEGENYEKKKNFT